MAERERNDYLNILKFLACMLITNSHQYYRSEFLKVGGGWGNALFFIITGYLIANISLPFVPWIIKRYKRLIPMTFLMQLLMIAITPLTESLVWFFMSSMWFVTALLIYYLLYYPMVSKRKILPAYVIYVVGYIIYYCHMDKTVFFVELYRLSWFKVYFYFGIVLIGALIKYYDNYVKRIPLAASMCCAFIGLTIWSCEYLAIMVFNKGLMLQFLIHVGITLFATGSLISALKLSELYPLILNNSNPIIMIADSTLEIYLFQNAIAYSMGQLTYPLNIIIFWPLAVIGGVLIHKYVHI